MAFVPPGLQTFADANGVPVSLGTVAFYIPNTTTDKDTWSDSGMTSLNVNPVPLDAAGRAAVWGLGSYRQVVKDALGNTVWDKIVEASLGAADLASTAAGKGDALVGSDDGASGSLWTTVKGFIAYLRSSAGSAIVGFLQSGTGAVTRTAQAKMRDVVSVKDFGAVGDGATNDSAACVAAITAVGVAGGTVWFPAGTYKLGSGLGTIPDNVHLLGAGKAGTTLKKAFNGDIATLGLNCTASDLSVNGDGSNFTGRGFVITAGSSAGTGYQKIRNVSIYDMASYCVEWTASAAGWAGGMFNCDVQRTGNTGDCLKMPGTETNGNRMLIDVFAGSGPLVDFAGAANVICFGCSSGSGGGAAHAFQMTAASAKIQIVGGRWGVGGGTTTLLGQNHVFAGNSHAGPFNFGDGTADSLANSSASGNNYAGSTVTYNPNLTSASSANAVEMPFTAHTATWTTGGTAPAIGNGGINSSYTRDGQIVTLTIEFTAGSTTTFGTGAWSFALPIKAAARKAIGSASMIDSSAGAHYYAAARIEENATTLQIYPDQANIVQNTSPFAWASGDTLMLTISYFAV